MIEIKIDRTTLEGHVNLIGVGDTLLSPAEADLILADRPPHPDLQAHANMPDDTRLWAALQEASGGTWFGCVYDVDRIIAVLKAGTEALKMAQTEVSQP